METGGSMPHSQGLSNNPILSLINSIPRISTYLFKVYSTIVLPPTPKGVFLVGLTNSMAYGTRRFNAAFTRALQ